MILEFIDEIAGYHAAGREVVVAFKPGQWGSRGGTHNFYPTSVMEYAHTAPLEMKDGKLQIQNTLATSHAKLISALGIGI